MKSFIRRLLQTFKDDKIMLVKDKGREKYKLIESKVTIKNVALYYSLSQLFNCTILSKDLLQLIERCFPMFVDSMSFLEIDFKHILKILSSS